MQVISKLPNFAKLFVFGKYSLREMMPQRLNSSFSHSLLNWETIPRKLTNLTLISLERLSKKLNCQVNHF